MKEIRWTDDAFDSIVRIVGARTGLTFRPDQRRSTQEGIESAMRRTEVTDPNQFARLLGYDVDVLDDLIVELTVGETYFFREPDQFEVIRQQVLPEIVKRHGPEHRIRIWSAACASGEEPYSLAMLCDQEGLAKRCDILATDISSEALNKARKATYREWSLRGKTRTAARKYLQFDDDRYFVDPRIASLVRFEFLNLAMDVYPSAVTSTQSLDLILCRNVLIYFDRETIQDVARRLFRSLAEGGWLITASGDPSVADYAPFEAVVTDFGVFYRRTDTREAEPAPTTRHGSADLSQWETSGDETWLTSARTIVPRSESVKQPVAEPATVKRAQPESAEAALARGDYALAVELSSSLSADPAACVVQVKALANISTEDALRKCGFFTERHPLAPELHYLHAVLLMELNLDVEAVQAAQRAIFVDRSLALAHFLLGSILQRRGSLEGAQRAFRNALTLCESRTRDEILPLAENETAGDLAQAARHHMRVIQATLERTS